MADIGDLTRAAETLIGAPLDVLGEIWQFDRVGPGEEQGKVKLRRREAALRTARDRGPSATE